MTSPDDKLIVTDIAELYGIKPSTFRAYVTKRKDGRKHAPDADGMLDGRTPFWYRSTLENWRTP